MNNKDYKKTRMELMSYAKECIRRKSESSDQGNHGSNWFRKMQQPHTYLVGNKEFVFSVINIDGRVYMNKIF